MALYDPQQAPSLKAEVTLAYCLTQVGAQATADQINANLRVSFAGAYSTVTWPQVHNLAQLAAYLRTLPADYKDFDMENYAVATARDSRYNIALATTTICGTVACAVGHGPNAGIAPLPVEDWVDYTERAFGVGRSTDANMVFFGGIWTGWDNTPRGAGARIAYLLDNPTAHALGSLCHAAHGEQPLCYAAYLE